jgi:hypothetical protein
MTSWLTSDAEAARHPWKVRGFSFVVLAALVPAVLAVAGAEIRDNLTAIAVLAVAVGAAGTLLIEKTSSPRTARTASPVRRLAERRYSILVVFAAAVALAIVLRSPLPLAVLLPLAVVALPSRRP